MAIVEAFYAIIPSRNSDTYRITIYDLAASDTPSENNALYGYDASPSTNPVEIDIIHESVSIVYDAETDTLHSPIIGSRLDMVALLSNDTYYLIDILKARKEGDIAVKVDRHDGTITTIYPFYPTGWEDYWIGCLSQEAVTYAFSNPPLEVQLIFGDGLSLLRDVPYEISDGVPYTSTAVYRNLRAQIGQCLSHLPHIDLFSDTINAKFFVEQLDMYHWNHVDTATSEPGSILDKTGCNQNIWYDFRLHDNPFNRKQRLVTGGSTCYEVLEDIMMAVGCSLFQWQGAFHAISPFLEDYAGTDQSARAWRSDKRSLINPSFQASAAISASSDTDFENRTDYTDSVILEGSSLSFFNPVKAVSYTHTKGGAPLVIKEALPVTIHGDIFNTAGDYYNAPINSDPTTPSYDSGYGGYLGVTTLVGKEFPLSNTTFEITGNQVLIIKGRVVMDSILDAGDDLFVGAQPIIKLNLRVGNYYLSQDVAVVSDTDIDDIDDFGRIHIAIGNPMNVGGFDITTWKPIEISSDVAWTMNSSDTFDFPFLIDGQNDPVVDTIEHTDGEEVRRFPVGMNTRRHESHASRMRFRWEDRKKEQDLILNIVTPPLPGLETDVHQGIVIDANVHVYDNEQNLRPFADVDVPYTACRIHNLRILVGENKEDEDIVYVASSDTAEGLEIVNGGSTLLASRLTDYWGDMGMLQAHSPGHRTDGNEVIGWNSYWFSQAASGENPASAASGEPSMEVLCAEHLAYRQKTANIYNLTLLLADHHKRLPRPLRRIIIETGATDAVVHILRCGHNLMAGQYDIYGVEISRVGGGITGTNSDAANDIYRKGPKLPPGPMPNQKSAAVAGTTALQQTRISEIQTNKDEIELLQLFMEK